MAGVAIKTLASLSTVGGIGGAAYGVYAYNNTTDTLENYLVKGGFAIRQDKWDKVLETYKIEKTPELSIQGKEVTEKTQIETWCKDNLTKNINSIKDPLFEKSSKWCVEFKTIAESLGDDKELEKDEETLNGKFSSLPPEIRTLVEKEKVKPTPTENANGKKIKQWCTNNSKRRADDSNSSFMKDITDHCTKKKSV